MKLASAQVTYTVGHMFCGIGAGAKGFNDAHPRVGSMSAKFECLGGIDIDDGALANFERLTGVKGTKLDLFDREQFTSFHGHLPPEGWRESTPDDIRRAFQGRRPDVLFLSAPCKGFSGLLSAATSGTDKYQALNGLTLRGIMLMLETFKDHPIRIILFENVPRIATRGRFLLDRIQAVLRSYGYVFAETTHDCGEIGGLGQSRKRFLLVARHAASVPPFLYQPTKQKLRGVGEIIGKLPLPGDPIAGPMHRVPMLQWKTWVRLAFVPAGKDWRALNDLAVEGGVLRDFGILPDQPLRNGALGVTGWNDTAALITSQRAPGQGRFSVADPRPTQLNQTFKQYGVKDWSEPAVTITAQSTPGGGRHAVADPRVDGVHNDALGVRPWGEPARVVATRAGPTNGAHSVADPRYRAFPQALGVHGWEATIGTVQGQTAPSNGAFSIADPRIENGHPRAVHHGVRRWDQTAACVKGDMSVGTGPYAVSDPRLHGKPAFNNVFRIVPFEATSPAVAGPGGPAGGLAVADPRADGSWNGKSKYRVTDMDEPAGGVLAASTTGQGAFAVADPRGPIVSDAEGRARPHGKYPVDGWDGPALAVIGGRDNGAYAVADPRGGDDPSKLHGKHRVERWSGASRAVIAGRDNGASAVADPRPTHGPGAHQNKMRVVGIDDPAPTVTGSDRVGSGALSVADPRPGYSEQTHQNILAVTGFDHAAKSVTGAKHPAGGALSVADPRPVGLNAEDREGYSTQAHYGVTDWSSTAGAIPAYAKYDRGRWSVADPQQGYEPEPLIALPAPDERLVARIIARDGTWHRPFTTLDLAALQSIIDPDEAFGFDEERGWFCRYDFELIGKSDAMKREWIGNAVPSKAARGMAETIGETLLLADMGETFTLSTREIWTRPLAIALAVDPVQNIYGEVV